MSAFPGVSSYQSSSLGSKFVVIGVVCCQEMRRNALFHKVLPVLTKYFFGSIYRGNNRTDLVLKLLSQAIGLFDDMCEQMPYIFQAVDLLVKNGICEVHEGEIIYIATSHQKAVDYDMFTEAAIQESKSYTDRQFLREVISIV